MRLRLVVGVDLLLGWVLDAWCAAQTDGCQELISILIGEKKAKKMGAHVGAKECWLGASVIVPLRFLLIGRGTPGRSSRQADRGCERVALMVDGR
jgi:hypothetical protein